MVFQQKQTLKRDVITLDAHMLLAGHALPLLLARRHGVVVNAHAVQGGFGRPQSINTQFLIGDWLATLDAVEQWGALDREQLSRCL